MKAKSRDSMAKALNILRQVGEVPPVPRKAGAALSTVSEDLGELFLAELRSRRERLAKWVELLHREARLETTPRASRRNYRCCGLTPQRSGGRSAQHLAH